MKRREEHLPLDEHYAQEALQLAHQTGRSQNPGAESHQPWALSHQVRGNLQEADRHLGAVAPDQPTGGLQ